MDIFTYGLTPINAALNTSFLLLSTSQSLECTLDEETTTRYE